MRGCAKYQGVVRMQVCYFVLVRVRVHVNVSLDEREESRLDGLFLRIMTNCHLIARSVQWFPPVSPVAIHVTHITSVISTTNLQKEFRHAIMNTFFVASNLL